MKIPLFSIRPDTPKEFRCGLASKLFFRGERKRVVRNCHYAQALTLGMVAGLLFCCAAYSA